MQKVKDLQETHFWRICAHLKRNDSLIIRGRGEVECKILLSTCDDPNGNNSNRPNSFREDFYDLKKKHFLSIYFSKLLLVVYWLKLHICQWDVMILILFRYERHVPFYA